MAALVVLAPAAIAEGRFSVPQNERWKAECGSCHIAYPPQLLPAQSWQRLMSGLDRHFGSDASLAPAVAAEIYAQGARAEPGELRVLPQQRRERRFP